MLNFFSYKEEEINKNEERKIHFCNNRTNYEDIMNIFLPIENETTCEDILNNIIFRENALKYCGNDFEKNFHFIIIDIKNYNFELKLSNKAKPKKILGLNNELKLYFIINKEIKIDKNDNNKEKKKNKKDIEITKTNEFYVKNISLYVYNNEKKKFINKCSVSLSYEFLIIDEINQYILKDFYKEKKNNNSFENNFNFENIENPNILKLILYDCNRNGNYILIFKNNTKQKIFDSFVHWINLLITSKKYFESYNQKISELNIDFNIPIQNIINQINNNSFNCNFFLSKLKWAKILVNNKFISQIEIPEIILLILNYKDYVQNKDIMNSWGSIEIIKQYINSIKEDNESTKLFKYKFKDITDYINKIKFEIFNIQMNSEISTINDKIFTNVFKIDFFDYILYSFLNEDIINKLNNKLKYIGVKINGKYINEISIVLNKILAEVFSNIYHYKSSRNFIIIDNDFV